MDWMGRIHRVSDAMIRMGPGRPEYQSPQVLLGVVTADLDALKLSSVGGTSAPITNARWRKRRFLFVRTGRHYSTRWGNAKKAEPTILTRVATASVNSKEGKKAMNGTGVGWDSWAYRVFVIGGLLLVLVSILLAAIIDPVGNLAIRLGGIEMAVYLVVLLAYWWVQIGLRGYGATQAPVAEKKPDVNDLGVLQSWSVLSSAMAVQGGDIEAMKTFERASRLSMLIWFAWATVLVLLPVLGLALPLAFGLITSSQFGTGVFFYMGFLALTFVLIFFLPRRAANVNESILLTPLGLKLAQIPQAALTPGFDGPRAGVRGATVMEGSRHGRAVRIVVQSGVTTTFIGEPAPKFFIRSQAGKLTVEGAAPQALQSALKDLRKAKRWEGLELSGDAQGIQVKRRSRGQNMWLYDLWLSERIFNVLRA